MALRAKSTASFGASVRLAARNLVSESTSSLLNRRLLAQRLQLLVPLVVTRVRHPDLLRVGWLAHILKEELVLHVVIVHHTTATTICLLSLVLLGSVELVAARLGDAQSLRKPIVHLGTERVL